MTCIVVDYLLNKSELEKLRREFIVLVARALKEFFGFMATLGGGGGLPFPNIFLTGKYNVWYH